MLFENKKIIPLI